MPDFQTLLEGLRAEIDAKYDETVQALDVISKYLESPSLMEFSKVRAKRMSVRPQVLAVLKEWSTLEEIVDRTDLSTKQIRGVLCGKDTRELIERRGEKGVREYRLKPEVPTTSDEMPQDDLPDPNQN